MTKRRKKTLGQMLDEAPAEISRKLNKHMRLAPCGLEMEFTGEDLFIRMYGVRIVRDRMESMSSPTAMHPPQRCREDAMNIGWMIFDGEELYIIKDGMKIARRHNGSWISLEPGYHVYDEDDGIVAEFKAAEAEARQ
jgi:hypothetical protein